MAVTLPTWKIEVELAGVGGGWTDITEDVLLEQGMSWGHGAKGNAVTNNIAAPGSFAFSVDNSVNNSAATIGYYSPFNTARRVGWRLGIRVRLSAVGRSTYEFKGWINRLDPVLGLHVMQSVRVTCGDIIDKLSRQVVTTGQTLTGPSWVGAYQVLIGILPANLRNGVVTYYEPWLAIDGPTYCFDTIKRDKPMTLGEIQKLATSSDAYFFCTGNGDVAYMLKPRFVDSTVPIHHETSEDSGITLTGDDIVSARFPADIATIANTVRSQVTKRTIDSVNVTLFQTEASFNPAVGPGRSFRLKCQFVDPNQTGQRIGGANIVTPVATTDYTMNSAADGSGTNLTSSFSLSIDKNGADCTVTFTNNHATLRGYITSFKIRGKGLYTYNPRKAEARSAESEATYGGNAVIIDMPYQEALENQMVLGNGSEIDDHSGLLHRLRNRFNVPTIQNPSVTFIVDSAAKLTAFYLDIIRTTGPNMTDPVYMQRVSIQEPVSGFTSSVQFALLGVEKSWDGRRGVLTCTWYLDQYKQIESESWQLDESTLGETTVLG